MNHKRTIAAASAGVLLATLLAATPASADTLEWAGDDLEGWGTTENLLDSKRMENGELCVDVPGEGGVPWDAIVLLNGVAVDQDESYRLEFTARTEPANQSIRVIVGENGLGYRTVLDKTPQIGGTLDPYSFVFTSLLTFPETLDDPSNPEGQIAFQLGGSPEPFTFCLGSVVFEAGAEVVPYEPPTNSRVRVNQHGYLAEGPKRATLITDATDAVDWQLLDGDSEVASGRSEPRGVDPTAELNVHVIDFSGVTTEGTYTLTADGETSYPFTVSSDPYEQLRYDALNYFYLARSGIEIEADIVGEEYAREAGHVNDPEGARADSPNKGDYGVGCQRELSVNQFWTCDYTLDVIGGWYDAGDHGKYVVNGGIAVSQLLSTYERSLYAPTADEGALADGTLAVPESSNGIPDVLDEARWELEWMLRMQVPAGDEFEGMVHHKVQDDGWTGLPLMPADDPQDRQLHRPSTAATLNMAASAAHGARLWDEFDEAFADELLAAAEVAWDAAVANPEVYALAADGDDGGGPYDDNKVGDEFYWAAAELYLTTGEQKYLDHLLENEFHEKDIWRGSGFDWKYTAALGRMDLATVPSDVPGRDAIRQSVVDGADAYLAIQREQPFGQTYGGSRTGKYEWGSNSMILNNQVVIGTAFDITGDEKYSAAVLEAMDYLLGRNALDRSYITGYGSFYSENQHSRWFAASINPDYPHPPKGSIAGGPNSEIQDPVAKSVFGDNMLEDTCVPQFCYLDEIQSWSTNEITINWNSALSWVANFAADQERAKPESGAAWLSWLWWALGGLLLAGAVVAAVLVIRRRRADDDDDRVDEPEVAAGPAPATA